jgi:peptide deformylase
MFFSQLAQPCSAVDPARSNTISRGNSFFAGLFAMAIRPILIIPDARLRAVADPIVEIDEEIKTLAKDMLDTMYDAPGIGLAAPQIGVMKRIVVMDLAGEDEPADPLVMINPEITSFGDEIQVTEEGCLSIPELYYEVERPSTVTVTYTDLDGKEVVKDADGKLAVCIQHELDHLDGVLYIDYLSRLKRDRVIKKFEKQAKLAAR